MQGGKWKCMLDGPMVNEVVVKVSERLDGWEMGRFSKDDDSNNNNEEEGNVFLFQIFRSSNSFPTLSIFAKYAQFVPAGCFRLG